MIGVLVTVALGGLLIYLVHIYISRASNFWKVRGVPYVPGSALFGNMTGVMLRKISMAENLMRMYKALEGHKFGGYFLFQTPVLMVLDPELINNFLIKDFSHFHDRNLPSSEEFDLLGSSLVSLTGQRWRSLRYKLTPTFTSGKLKRMFDQLVSCSDDIIEHVTTYPKGEAIEIRDLMFKYAINVIGSVAFGLKIDSHKAVEGRNKIFIDMSRRFFQPSTMQFIKFFLRSSYPWLVEALGLKMNDPEMDAFFTTLVTDTIRHRQETGTRRDDFLQLMIDLRKNQGSKDKDTKVPNSMLHLEAEDQVLMNQLKNVPKDGKTAHADVELTDQILVSQSFVFIAAGSETTAAALHFALFEVAKNPEVQEKVHQEIDTVLANQPFTYQAVREMKYLENVLNESLRLYTAGPIIPRFCTEDYQIPGTDIVLEKGTQIHIPVMSIHKDPKYFPQPDEFMPERFEVEIPKGVYFPFGGGPRICIAMRLAILQMKVFLARLLMLYRVEVSTKTQVPLQLLANSIVQHVKGGVWLHFEPRKVK